MKQISSWHQKYSNWINSSAVKKYIPYILLFLILVIAFFLRVKFLLGTERIDSLKYTQAAYNLLQGTYFDNNLTVGLTRITFIFPTAFFYKIFGVNEFSSILWILLSNLLGIIILYAIGSKINKTVGLIAASIAIFYPLEVVCATRMMPDGLTLLFLGLPILLFLNSEETTPSKKYWYLFFAGACWALSYYIKVNLVFFFPIFIAVYMFYKKSFTVKYLLLIAGFFTIWLGVCTYFYANTGIFTLYENQRIFFHRYQQEAFDSYNGRITTSILRDYTPTTEKSADRKIFRKSDYVISLIPKIVEKIEETKATKFFLLASLVSIIILLSGPRRKKYHLVYILIIASYLYELSEKSVGFGMNVRYLTTMSIPTIISIAAAIYDLSQYKNKTNRYIVFIFISIICFFGVFIAGIEIFYESRHQNRELGMFYEAQLIVQNSEVDSWKGNIIVPEGNWNRIMNMYLSFENTGYNWFDPNSAKSARLRNYIDAGAKENGETHKLYFDKDNYFVKNSIIVIQNYKDDLDITNLEYQVLWHYSNPQNLDISVLKVKSVKE